MDGMSCAAVSMLLTLLMLFHAMTSSMPAVRMEATMMSKMVRVCCRKAIWLFGILWHVGQRHLR